MFLYKKYLDEIKDQFEFSKHQLKELNKNADLTKNFTSMDLQFIEVKNQILSSLKENLSKLVPDPKLLDFTCEIALPQGQVILKDIPIKPTTKIADIKGMIKNGLTKINEPLQHFNDTTGHIIIVPPERKELLAEFINRHLVIETFKDLDSYLHEAGKYELINFDANSTDSLMGHKIKPNSVLIYIGDYKLKSAAPAECLTYDYQQGAVMDYFACEQCGVNCKNE